MKLLFRYLRNYRKLIVLALVLATVNTLFSLIDPAIFSHILDDYVRKFESIRFESWNELRAFKRQYTLPRLKCRSGARIRRISLDIVQSNRSCLFNKIAHCARAVAKKTERDWRLLGYAADER